MRRSGRTRPRWRSNLLLHYVCALCTLLRGASVPATLFMDGRQFPRHSTNAVPRPVVTKHSIRPSKSRRYRVRDPTSRPNHLLVLVVDPQSLKTRESFWKKHHRGSNTRLAYSEDAASNVQQRGKLLKQDLFQWNLRWIISSLPGSARFFLALATCTGSRRWFSERFNFLVDTARVFYRENPVWWSKSFVGERFRWSNRLLETNNRWQGRGSM